MSVLDLDYGFSSLSVRDLLDARDAYHFHLLHRPNVIGTAIGLYLIRTDDAWPRQRGPEKSPKGVTKPPRTLFNSEVRNYSWPCVLVFVRKWVNESDFGMGKAYEPTDLVPKTLYLPDGRAVPVCVVHAPETAADAIASAPQPVPAGQFGGGLPVEIDVQGETHVATAGCLVSDGHLTYALTARHAAGPAGTVVSLVARDGAERIGISSPLQLTRKLFTDVYATFAGRFSYVGFDVGLVRLDDVTDWTSNTYGLPPLGPMADLSATNISLRLIDQPLLGVGGVSGMLSGRIKALFYRYRSVGGYDYVADYLVGPEGNAQTRHGDSGMVWHLDVTELPDRNKPPVALAQRDLRPLAMEWGGQVFGDGRTKASFALATSLSNICRELDVELLTDMSRGVSGYWGRTGHYSIAALAIELIGNQQLKTLMRNNLSIISFDAEAIAQKTFDKSIGQIAAADEFVPLADVPDEIWKQIDFGKKPREGGRDTRYREGPEHPNHYADIDVVVSANGQTFIDWCLADHKRVKPAAWLTMYEKVAKLADAAGDTETAASFRDPLHQGLLPFRIWQFFTAMVDFLKAGDIVGFVTAAGAVAHYVGDSSQPLHGSVFADGIPGKTAQRYHPQSDTWETVKYGSGVHSAYETNMIAFKAPELLPLVATKAAALPALPKIKTGSGAAVATLESMARVARILPPIKVIDTFEEAGGAKNQKTYTKMWDKIGDETADVMAEGVRSLALLWESAWLKAGTAATASLQVAALDPDDVRNRYIDKTFVPSLTLDKIAPYL